jgi:23S rRNA (adenine2503-C2)-methyltransferase
VKTPTNLAELELSELEASIDALGVQAFHARQIFQWIYRRGVIDFGQMTDLSSSLRKTLPERFVIRTPEIHQRQQSGDGTEKFLLALGDGRLIESVYIPDTPRQTFCVSTQVGCAMRCGFCLTGKMGLVRNLTAGEIVGQVRVLAHTLGLAETRFNVVFMGMGEPLHNYDPTMKAIRILAETCGFAMTPSRITLSTVGVPAALERLAKETVVPNLAVSLHAATDELREQLVPVNRAHGLADILAACRKFPVAHRRRITFEYVLLAGINDSAADAQRLARLLTGIRAKVNLIPLNEAPGIPYRRPADTRVSKFARTLAARKITVSVRKSRGPDIRAACGQLIVEGANPSPAQRIAADMATQPQL